MCVACRPVFGDGLFDCIGDVGCFAFAYLRGVWFVGMRFGVDDRDRWVDVGVWLGRRQWDVRRLVFFCWRDDRLEHGVNLVDDWFGCMEVGVECDGVAELFLSMQIGFDVGTTEPIDRLFRVVDDEDRFGRHFDVALVGRRGVGVIGDPDCDLDLDRVGVLEFVEQQSPILLSQCCLYCRVAAK